MRYSRVAHRDRVLTVRLAGLTRQAEVLQQCYQAPAEGVLTVIG